MISKDAFAQEVRELTDTAFAVTYLILGNSADSEDAMSQAVLRAFENRGKLRKQESCPTLIAPPERQAIAPKNATPVYTKPLTKRVDGLVIEEKKMALSEQASNLAFTSSKRAIASSS